MPPEQRPWRDDEGTPTAFRQEPAGRRKEEPVGPPHRRPRNAPKDADLVTQHDEFQFLEFVRLATQDNELQNSPKDQVAEREKHEASRRDQKTNLSYAPGSCFTRRRPALVIERAT
jgi:hypothetical protein